MDFFSIAAEIDNDLKEMLGLKDNERVASVLTIGYPEITYHRTVVRNRANITKISRKKREKELQKKRKLQNREKKTERLSEKSTFFFGTVFAVKLSVIIQ